MRRGAGGGTGMPVLASVALHGLAVLAMSLAARGSGPALPPRVKVYAVDIVSPPPNVLGAPMAEPPANQDAGPAAEPAAPAPEPAAAEPDPPAPEPDPAPPAPKPAPAPPRTPEKAPEPKPAPERTPQRPATPPRPAPTPPRTTPAPPRTTPATTPARPAGGAATGTTTRPATGTAAPGQRPGTGTAANNTRGDGTRTGPATGRNPDASSPGGEGLTVRSAGARCPSPGYCENIVRQVRRFFRAPEGAEGGSGNVCFRILRDGTSAAITTERVRGGAAFRLALMEAAEQAGTRRAFGALPAAFGAEELPVCVDISPSIAQ